MKTFALFVLSLYFFCVFNYLLFIVQTVYVFLLSVLIYFDTIFFSNYPFFIPFFLVIDKIFFHVYFYLQKLKSNHFLVCGFPAISFLGFFGPPLLVDTLDVALFDPGILLPHLQLLLVDSMVVPFSVVC